MAELPRTARQRRQRTHRRRLAAAGTGLVVLGAGGVAAIAATAGGDPGLRLATVGRASITQLVETSGTVTSSHKSAPSFSVSGTVRSVPVRIGQRVAKGQVLARLDTTDLQAEVDSAQSELASARQQLAADKSGQTSAAPSTATGNVLNSAMTSSGTAKSAAASSGDALLLAKTTPSPSPTQPGGRGTGTSRSGDLGGLVKQITAAQTAVISAQAGVDDQQQLVDQAQQAVDSDIVKNAQLRDAQKAGCSTSTDGSTGPSTDACTSARADYEAFADTLTADGKVLDAAITAQDANVVRLDAAIAALDKLLDALPAAAASAGGSGTGGTPSAGTGGNTGTPTGGSGTASGGTGSPGLPSGTSGSGSSTSGTGAGTAEPASGAQLAADQAQIDSAQAQLREAKQSLDAATLRSPVSGRIAAIGYSVGEGASGDSITVVGSGVQKVSISVPFAQIDLVKPGQHVAVFVDGQKTPLHGTVTKIGLLSSTDSGTTTFPVTVQLAANSERAYDGTGADVRITTGTVHNVIAVPNSALHAGRGDGYTVTVVRDGQTSTVQIGLGVAGTAITQVTSGLKVGDRVVLADYSQAVPASTNSSITGPGGGFFPVFTGGSGGLPVFPGGN